MAENQDTLVQEPETSDDVITEAIIRQRVHAAGYNRAPSSELIGKLKDAGVVCVPTCGATKHAVKAEKLGADIIIVQGGEGGGHTGAVPTTLLIPQVVDAVGDKVPVVAAGGFKGHVDRWQIVNWQPPASIYLDIGCADVGTGAPEGDRSSGICLRTGHR